MSDDGSSVDATSTAPKPPRPPVTPATLIEDTTTRLAKLARALAQNGELSQHIPAGSPEEQLEPLTKLLQHVLENVEAVDPDAHRYRLRRHVDERLHAAFADIVDKARAEEWTDARLLEACLAHPNLAQLEAELESEFAAAAPRSDDALSELASAAERDEPALADFTSSEEGDGAGGGAEVMDDLDRWLKDELDADLPPFLEMPGALTAAINASSAYEASQAWSKLSLFSDFDLLETDQWDGVPPALLNLMLSPHLDHATRERIADLHSSMFDDAGPPQRAPIVLNACNALGELRARASAPPNAVPTAEQVAEERATLRCVQLVTRARLELCNDGTMMHDEPLGHLLGAFVDLAQRPPWLDDGAAPPGGTRPMLAPSRRAEPAYLLAAMDPSAKWVQRALARAKLQRPVWHALVDSGLVSQAEAAMRAPLPSPPPAGGAASAQRAADGTETDMTTPFDWELNIALGLHHTCVLGLALRHAAAHDANSYAYEGQLFDAGWAAKTVPPLLARVAALPPALAPLGEISAFISECMHLALDSLQASIAELAHAQCVSRGVWTDATVGPLLQPFDDLCGGLDVASEEAAEASIHASVARAFASEQATRGGGIGRAAHLTAASLLAPTIARLVESDAVGVLRARPATAVLLCRAALGLLSTPEELQSAQALGVQCSAALGRLIDGPSALATAQLVLPSLTAAVARAASASAGAAHRGARLSSVALVAHAFCRQSRTAALLPKGVLPHLAVALMPEEADTPEHASLPRPGHPGPAQSTGVSYSEELDEAHNYGLMPIDDSDDGDGAIPMLASSLAGTRMGLQALGVIGVVEQRAMALVQAAQRGDASVSEIHGEVAPNSRVAVWSSLANLAAVLAWPHASAVALATPADAGAAEHEATDWLPVANALDLPLEKLLVVSRRKPFSALPYPECFDDSHVVGILLAAVLCTNVHIALTLRRRFGLVAHLEGMHRAAVLDSAGDTAAADAATAGGVAERLAREWQPSTIGNDEAAVDLTAVCRARLLLSLRQWGTPSEWSSTAPLHALATRDEHPFARLCAVAHDSAGGAPPTAGTVDTALAAVNAAPSARVQLAAPLLSGAASREVLDTLWANLEQNHTGGAALVLAADALDGAAAPAQRAGAVAGAVGQLPDEVAAGAKLMVEYAQRQFGDSSCDEAGLAKVLQRAGGDGGRCFDAYAALVYVLCGDADAACIILAALGSHAAGPYLHPSPTSLEAWLASAAPSAAPLPQQAPTALGVLVGLVEEIVAIELPTLHNALTKAGMPAGLPAARWLVTGWLNVLAWRSLVAATLLPLLAGPDMSVYLCVAALHHVWSTQPAAAPPSTLTLRLMLPLETFDVLASVPYACELRGRHGKLCEQAMHGL